MHEASLVQGLLSIACASVEDYNARIDQQRAAHEKEEGPKAIRISSISCSLGLLSCVEPQTVIACFELFAEGTLAEGATLQLSISPLDCHCSDCGRDFQLHQRHFSCPFCHGDALQFSGGHGMVMTGIDVVAEDSEG